MLRRVCPEGDGAGDDQVAERTDCPGRGGDQAQRGPVEQDQGREGNDAQRIETDRVAYFEPHEYRGFAERTDRDLSPQYRRQGGGDLRPRGADRQPEAGVCRDDLCRLQELPAEQFAGLSVFGPRLPGDDPANRLHAALQPAARTEGGRTRFAGGCHGGRKAAAGCPAGPAGGVAQQPRQGAEDAACR